MLIKHLLERSVSRSVESLSFSPVPRHQHLFALLSVTLCFSICVTVSLILFFQCQFSSFESIHVFLCCFFSLHFIRALCVVLSRLILTSGLLTVLLVSPSIFSLCLFISVVPLFSPSMLLLSRPVNVPSRPVLSSVTVFRLFTRLV